MIKTHKIALNPNCDQIAWFYQQCGYAKFAYNSAVSDFKTELASDNFLSMYDLNKRFNQKRKRLIGRKHKINVLRCMQFTISVLL